METRGKTSTDRGRITDEADPSVQARYRLNDIFCSAWLSHAITALANTGVADTVGEDPMPVRAIAAKAGLHDGALYRALRAAAANGVFVESSPGVFAHNPASRLLRSDHPHSWKGMAAMWNHPSCLSGWMKFAQALGDGHSGIQHAFGKTLYEHLSEDPRRTQAFSDAMTSNSAHAAASIARVFPFERFEQVTDLGGGIGVLLAEILHQHAHLRGELLEIQPLMAAALAFIQAQKLTARMTFTVGNFIECIPAGSDVYMIKNSLWNWDDAACSAVMANVRKAVGDDKRARFLIVEYVIDTENAPWTTLYDLQILNMPGGRARTLSEYVQLLENNRFELETVRYAEDQTLIEARPR